jgi:hypothetical protein
MLQRTEKGKQARRYFIECEKRSQGHLEVIKSEMALLIENETLKLDNERMKPRSEWKWFSPNLLLILGKSQKY